MLYATFGWSVDFKVFWRCSDTHLEAIDVYQSNDKQANLFLNYIDQAKRALFSSPINVKSLAELPSNFDEQTFLMLGNEDHIFVNCVGQVNLNPHDLQGKVVFDVHRNAFNCPLIPKGCSE